MNEKILNLKNLIIILILLIVIVAGYFTIKKNIHETGPLIIGGCAGVSLDNVQECCDNWARENTDLNVPKTSCAGQWIILDNHCSWECGVE